MKSSPQEDTVSLFSWIHCLMLWAPWGREGWGAGKDKHHGVFLPETLRKLPRDQEISDGWENQRWQSKSQIGIDECAIVPFFFFTILIRASDTVWISIRESRAISEAEASLSFCSAYMPVLSGLPCDHDFRHTGVVFPGAGWGCLGKGRTSRRSHSGTAWQAGMAPDVVLQLVLPPVLLPRRTCTRRGLHVEPHVPVKTSLLLKDCAVDADQPPLWAGYQWPRVLPGLLSGLFATACMSWTLHQALQITVQVDGQGLKCMGPSLLGNSSAWIWRGWSYLKLPNASGYAHRPAARLPGSRNRRAGAQNHRNPRSRPRLAPPINHLGVVPASASRHLLPWTAGPVWTSPSSLSPRWSGSPSPAGPLAHGPLIWSRHSETLPLLSVLSALPLPNLLPQSFAGCGLHPQIAVCSGLADWEQYGVGSPGCKSCCLSLAMLSGVSSALTVTESTPSLLLHFEWMLSEIHTCQWHTASEEKLAAVRKLTTSSAARTFFQW